MPYTLAHIWSGVRSRLRDPNAGDPAAITVEANHALNELRGHIRQSREDWLDVVEVTDIISGRDVYDWPSTADTIKLLERLDLVDERGVYPSYVMSYYDRPARGVAEDTKWAVADTFVFLPGRRVQVQPTPTADFPNGLRWTYLPQIVPLSSPEDRVVGLPDQFFEWAVVGTVDRMRQFRGVELADPQAYEMFRREQSARLVRELRPAALAQPPRVIDEDEFYNR